MDTANKRASAIGVALAFRLVLPAPDATVGTADRPHVAYSYAGLSAAPPIPIPNMTRARGVLVSSPSTAREVRIRNASAVIGVQVS